MVKVSIEVRSGTARFMVRVKARDIQRALSIVQARYPASIVRAKYPIDPENFFVDEHAA